MHISYKICDITLKEEHLQICIRVRTKENYYDFQLISNHFYKNYNFLNKSNLTCVSINKIHNNRILNDTTWLPIIWNFS